jgi:glyoxylase-like metal-dependent hydrolase (beta-lactamase superfamily II)
MVDSPRWAKAVVDQLEAWGGLSDILLTHQDDVADADRYARHFGARVWIHSADRAAAPYADQVLVGDDPSAIDEELTAIPVPGHTRGSVVYLFAGRCLFTGDSLAWDFERNDLTAFRNYCWSWPTQIGSLSRLSRFDFAWIFAGHGGSKHLPAGEMKSRLAFLVHRMEHSPDAV